MRHTYSVSVTRRSDRTIEVYSRIGGKTENLSLTDKLHDGLVNVAEDANIHTGLTRLYLPQVPLPSHEGNPLENSNSML